MKKRNLTIQTIAVLIVCVMALGICAGGCGEKTPVWAQQPGLIRDPVKAMMDAVCAGDYAGAAAFMQG